MTISTCHINNSGDRGPGKLEHPNFDIMAVVL